MDFLVNLRQTGFFCRPKAVESISQPVICAVKKQRDRRHFDAGFVRLSVLCDRLLMRGNARLCAAVSLDAGYFDHALAFSSNVIAA